VKSNVNVYSTNEVATSTYGHDGEPKVRVHVLGLWKETPLVAEAAPDP